MSHADHVLPIVKTSFPLRKCIFSMPISRYKIINVKKILKKWLIYTFKVVYARLSLTIYIISYYMTRKKIVNIVVWTSYTECPTLGLINVLQHVTIHSIDYDIIGGIYLCESSKWNNVNDQWDTHNFIWGFETLKVDKLMDENIKTNKYKRAFTNRMKGEALCKYQKWETPQNPSQPASQPACREAHTPQRIFVYVCVENWDKE